jgi:hypothetical protein
MSRLNRITLITGLAALSALAVVQAATVAGSEADAKKAIEARQHVFDQIKDLNDPLGKILKRQSPMDPAVVAANAAKIQALAVLAERRQVRPVIDSTFPLERIGDAHRKIEGGGMKGKIVIMV